MMSSTTLEAGSPVRPMTREERKVIIASSLGTVFEWYDFYLYGSLAAVIGANFFSQYPEATRNIFALFAFARIVFTSGGVFARGLAFCFADAVGDEIDDI